MQPSLTAVDIWWDSSDIFHSCKYPDDDMSMLDDRDTVAWIWLWSTIGKFLGDFALLHRQCHLRGITLSSGFCI